MIKENIECRDAFFQTVAAILLRAFLIGLAFMLLWLLFYWIAPGWMFEMNAKWFDIDRRDFDLINYYGIGFVKISILLFFFFPYLAIKSTLRQRKRKSSDP